MNDFEKLSIQEASKRLQVFCPVYDKNYKVNWHHKEIINALEEVEKGNIHLLIIEMPPRHGKSQLASIYFPAWYLGRNPDKEIITASYSGDLAKDFGSKTRDVVNSEIFQNIFPEVKLKQDSKAKDKWNTNQGGSYTSVGRGGATTGRGANIFLVDDPFKDREEAESDLIREKVWEWYRSVALTRLEKGGSVVIIHTRWHLDDLIGRVVDKAEEIDKPYTRVTFPAIAEEDEKYRKEGEPLWPYKYDLKKLNEIRQELGVYNWAALYQQNPVASEAQDFKEQWMQKTFSLAELENKHIVTFATIDPAQSKNMGSDYTGITVVAVDEIYNWYILYAKQLKLNVTERIELIFELWERFKKYRITKIGIEQKAFQDNILPLLQPEMEQRGIFPKVEELKDKGMRKEERILGLVPRFEYNRIYFKEHSERYDDTNELITQLLTFPRAKHDDIADSLSYMQDITYAPFGDIEDRVMSEEEARFEAKMKKLDTGLKITNDDY